MQHLRTRPGTRTFCCVATHNVLRRSTPCLAQRVLARVAMRALTPRLLRLPAILVVLANATPAPAQTPDPPDSGEAPSTPGPVADEEPRNRVLDEISGSFVAGPGWFDSGDVEDRLRAHGYEDIDTEAVVLGLSARIIFDTGIALGAGGALLGHAPADGSGDYDATLGYGVLRAEGGYALLHSARWLLLPKLALGAYSANVNLSDARDATFDELLETPGTTTNISSRGFLMGALLDFEARFAPGRTVEAPRGFFGVGLEAGYLYSIPLSGWRSDTGAVVDAGPDAPLTGGFVGVTLGGGVVDL